MPIIESLLDNDLYKFSMCQAVFHQFGDIGGVEYEFKCRSGEDLLPYKKEIEDEIRHLCSLKFLDSELEYLRQLPYMKDDFICFLEDFRLDRGNIFIYEDNNKLSIVAKGSWLETILFEVPVLAIVNEVYFRNTVKNPDYDEAFGRLQRKTEIVLQEDDFKFAEFGTRRRFNRRWQEEVIRNLLYNVSHNQFLGTSNLYFAKLFGILPIGTMAHEWIQAGQALSENLIESQKYMLHKWLDEYPDDLKIALTDTIGLESFLKDFDHDLAINYSGVRHDSGCPFEFADKVIFHYMFLGINPMAKTIVFSDGLNFKKSVEILEYCKHRINVSFGIGTNLTNDFPDVKPLSIVMKMQKCKGKPVAKISDEPEKAQCQSPIYLHELMEKFDVM